MVSTVDVRPPLQRLSLAGLAKLAWLAAILACAAAPRRAAAAPLNFRERYQWATRACMCVADTSWNRLQYTPALPLTHGRRLRPAAAAHAAAYTCADVANAIVSVNTLMDNATKAVTASITLACNGTFTDCGDTMELTWAGYPNLKKPAGLTLTIAAAAACAKGASRPLMSSTVSSTLTGTYMIRMYYENVSLAQGLAARGSGGWGRSTAAADACSLARRPGAGKLAFILGWSAYAYHCGS